MTVDFDSLFRQHYSLARKIAIRVYVQRFGSGAWSDTQIDPIASEGLWNALEEYKLKPDATFGWLTLCVRHRISDLIDREASYAHRHTSLLEDWVEEENREEQIAYGSELLYSSAIGEQERDAIALRVVSGFGWDAIAERINTTQRNSKTIYYRGIGKLRDIARLS